MPQTPPAQLAVPFVVLHAAEQAPQFDTLVLLSVSQPSEARPLQLSQGAAQAIEHVPFEQVGTPWFVLHAAAQAPQCSVDVFRLVSHPLATLPSQFP